MSEQMRAVQQAIAAQTKPHRSFPIALGGVVIRGLVWGLLIYGLMEMVPRVLPALLALQPRLEEPRGPVMQLINFMRDPQKSVPMVALFLLFVDLPLSYLSSSSLALRRWWSRLMMLIPLGVGLAAGAGFVMLYLQTLKLMMQDTGVGGY